MSESNQVSASEGGSGWVDTIGLLRAARTGGRRHWPTAHPAHVSPGTEVDTRAGASCQATHRRRAAGPRVCSRSATARVTGAQRSTIDLCAQHARMAADRPRLVREWLTAAGGHPGGGPVPDAPPLPATAPSADGAVAGLALGMLAELGALAVIRARLSQTLTRAGWPADLQHPVLLAAGEAAANAIEHGSRAGARVRVSVEAGPERALVRVADGGRLGSVIPLVDPAPPPSTHCRGRGLLLMRTLSERMGIHSGGDGTVVLLEFSRGAPCGGP